MTPTDLDREAAREWAERHGYGLHALPLLVTHAAELVAAGRTPLTWTATPPTEGTFDPERPWWWFRSGPGRKKKVVRVTHCNAKLYAIGEGVADTLEDLTRHHPACQWAGPIPAPLEPRTREAK